MSDKQSFKTMFKDCLEVHDSLMNLLDIDDRKYRDLKQKLVETLEKPYLMKGIFNDIFLIYSNCPALSSDLMAFIARTNDILRKESVQKAMLEVFEGHFLLKVPYPWKSAYFHLFRQFYNLGVFSLDLVIKFVSEFAKFHSHYVISKIWLFLYFAKEICEADLELYND